MLYTSSPDSSMSIIEASAKPTLISENTGSPSSCNAVLPITCTTKDGTVRVMLSIDLLDLIPLVWNLFSPAWSKINGWLLFVPGVGLMVRVVGLGSSGPEFKSHLVVELITGGIDSACHPSEVGKMSTSLLGWLSHSSILCRNGDPSRIVPNSPGNCFGSTDFWQTWQDSPHKELLPLDDLNMVSSWTVQSHGTLPAPYKWHRNLHCTGKH